MTHLRSITFLSKVEYTIGDAVVSVTYEISFNTLWTGDADLRF